MDVSHFLSIFNRGNIWTAAVIIWLCVFVGYSFYRVSPSGMSAQTRVDVFDVGKGPGMPLEDVYACLGRDRFHACTKHEAIRQVIVLSPFYVAGAFWSPLFAPLIQPALFIPLWFHLQAFIENPYLSITFWYLLLRGFVFLVEMVKDPNEER